MALVPYFLFSPNTILSILGFIRGPDKTIPTPAEDWTKATVNVIIPAHNEEYTICLALASLMQQTIQPKNIVLIDDGSTDNTVDYAKTFCELHDLKITIIKRAVPIGKTPTIKRQAREFEADVEFILDGDTILQSPNYIERCVQELYQAIGIASACGVIEPLYDKERIRWLKSKKLNEILKAKPNAALLPSESLTEKFLRGAANMYREILYLFLQRFIYVGQMAFFGSITNPVGCAVAYRQKYVQDFFDRYEPLYGDDLSNSEDIFCGFALIHKGYRNIQIRDVCAQSSEPQLNRLPKQIYLWSSAFVQSCFFFPALVLSPFKGIKRMRYRRKTERLYGEKIRQKRKIQEPYRQKFGDDWTEQWGRPMGWVISLTLAEKLIFSIFFWLCIIMGWWLPLAITLGLESIFAVTIITIIAPKNKLKTLGKALLITPCRYLAVLTDLFTLVHFSMEKWVFKYTKWRK